MRFWRSVASILTNPDDAWEHYGRADPYYGVLTDERFRRGRLDAAARAEFFASGERHVEQLVEIIRAEIDPAFAPRRALDFGCGVGRVLLPLARRCAEVVGVDVSPAMLAEARANLDEQGIRNAELVAAAEFPRAVTGRFDLIHSYIVFQHVPRERGERAIEELLTLLDDGGVGALQLTFARRVSPARLVLQQVRARVPGVHAVANVLRGRPALDPNMQMNAYDLNRVFALLQAAGCGRVHVRFTDHGGHLGAFLFFRKQPQPFV